MRKKKRAGDHSPVFFGFFDYRILRIGEWVNMKHAYQRWLIKASIIHIGIGIFIGLFLYLSPLFGLPYYAHLKTVHVHQILFGGVIQLIMGVALWMFPRKKQAPHYTSPTNGMILVIIINLGTILRSTFEIAGKEVELFLYLASAGAILQTLSLFIFMALIFKRIRKP